MRTTQRPWGALVTASVVFLLSACSGDDGATSAIDRQPQAKLETKPTESAVEPVAEPVPESEPAAPRVVAPERRAGGRPLAELLATLGDRDVRHGWAPRPPPANLPRAIHDCDGGEYGVCAVDEVAAFEAPGSFVLLTADFEESGHATVFVTRDDGTHQEQLLSFGAFGRSEAPLQRRLRRFARLPTLPNLISARSFEQFSLNEYPVLVRLSGPLDGWLLWLETTGIEDREQRLHLMRSDGTDDRVVSTRPAEVGPCGGDGYWCEINNTDPDADCTDAVLEAEGGLCALPTSISYVAVAPNGLIAVTGSHMVPGHGGYPPSHWVTMLPEDIRP